MSNTNIAIQTTKIAQSKIDGLDFNNLPFGKIFTDHMFTADYIQGEWTNLSVVPYGDITISPASAVLHYGQEIFEGMKAYKFADGTVSLFRPDKNLQRLNKSAVRMSMPEIPEAIFMAGIQELLKLDAAWIPTKENHALYLRPFMFANDPYLGVKPSEHYKFMVIACPVGAFFNKAISVKIETTFTRADDGGVGYAKTGGNYARSLFPTAQAAKEGFDQVVWTDAETKSFIEESGAANIMVVINGTLVTPLLRNTILDGITRNSVLQVAKHLGITVEERKLSISEVISGIQDGSLTEAFAVGTAATVTQIASMGFENQLYTIKNVENRPVSGSIVKFLDDLRYGKSEDTFGWNSLVK